MVRRQLSDVVTSSVIFAAVIALIISIMTGFWAAKHIVNVKRDANGNTTTHIESKPKSR